MGNLHSVKFLRVCHQQKQVIGKNSRKTFSDSSKITKAVKKIYFLAYMSRHRRLIQEDDLPGVISKNSSIALYADDSKMYRVISTQEDLSTFQSDIDKISDWCKMNKMRINTKKCKIMRITRKKSPLVGEYNIEGQPLESVNVYKVLGLYIYC